MSVSKLSIVSLALCACGALINLLAMNWGAAVWAGVALMSGLLSAQLQAQLDMKGE